MGVSIASGHQTKCPDKCTKCFVLGKLVYQNMLLLLIFCSGVCMPLVGVISTDSRRCEVSDGICENTGEDETLRSEVSLSTVTSLIHTQNK